jgi:hypothetical protein
MIRYLLRVYSEAGYYPDKTLHSVSRRRVERRARQLQREGFGTELLTVHSPRDLPISASAEKHER